MSDDLCVQVFESSAAGADLGSFWLTCHFATGHCSLWKDTPVWVQLPQDTSVAAQMRKSEGVYACVMGASWASSDYQDQLAPEILQALF